MKSFNFCATSLAITASHTLASSTPVQIFNFSSYVDIENSHLRPNGHLLLSTFDNGSLFSIDPSAPNPQAELVSELPGATALCAIASIGYDKYAVVGGVRGNYSYTNETIYIVDYGDSNNASKATISVAATIPDAIMLNGGDSLPAPYQEVVMVGDARQGAIFRVNTTSGSSEIAIQDDALAPPANASTPLGINGLKIRGDYLYYTVTSRNTFGRVAITSDGFQNGDLETVAVLNPGSEGYNWDDFIFDARGTAYVAQKLNAIARISPNGTQLIVAGGGNSTTIWNPTSLSLAEDGKTAYVTTSGRTVGDVELSGTVVEMQL